MPVHAVPRRNWTAVAIFSAAALAFGVAFTQWPLYSENQHTKFLHGLAAAGYGNLDQDWLAQTIDPLPVFSALVYLVYRLLHPDVFYLIHALLLGLYLVSLTGIADAVFGLTRTRVGTFWFVVLLIALHSSLLPPFSWPVLGVSFGWLLQSGVANQYLINPALQPSTFGVLLVLSIWLFLRRRPVAAAASAALAAVLHSTYLPSAAVLTLAYVLLTLRQRGIRSALSVGAIALIIVLPVLLHSALRLGPTSAELFQRSQEIIVNFRIPHHSLPELWLDRTVAVKLAIVIAALVCVRRSPLFFILLLALVTAIGLTWLQTRIDSDLLAFVAPWRISVFLVPVSTGMLVAAGITALERWSARRFERSNRPAFALAALGAVWLAFVVGRGALAMRDGFAARAADDRRTLFAYVAQSRQPGDLYLVPTGLAEFRLETGAPVLVTFKSHPYKDVEVIEWQQRVAAANEFYAAPDCEQLAQLGTVYGITHVLFDGGQSRPDCDTLETIFEDGRFVLARFRD